MLGIFHTIEIDGKEIYRGNEFTLQRENIYAGEVETCTGRRCADLVGWRYSDQTIEWDALPQDQMQKLLNLSGLEIDMTFTDEEGSSVTEKVIPRAITSAATRFTRTDGTAIWRNVGLQLQFIEAHNPEVV